MPDTKPSEFELIRRYFTRPVAHTDLAVGDDAALMTPRPGMQLAVSTDMLVAGTHFFADTAPGDLGWKAAAVNISDMAAMGAEPRWMFLALSLPAVDEAWVAAFAEGFAACCARFGVDWAGGDTTRGPLNLCPTVIGEVPVAAAIRRDGARAGDDIWVSGTPGLAALGLRHLRDGLPLAEEARAQCLRSLHRPQPRVELGLALRGVASAMQDVSDGLLGDLGHILSRSRLAAVVEDAALPWSPVLAACSDEPAARAALTAGGDDYELVFTAAPELREQVASIGQRIELPLTRIGQCQSGEGLRLLARDGTLQPVGRAGYDHFG
ncbi:thiamine-phosphate kinase [Uliginosibacterium sp. H1]|uniref:thiamine-phosphate kinase n=1 Tax=Uliginosibacterium sp. H1 TaxID=3114757 RepID=UPI002E16DC1E|nr:thiamine-phosphate kinase [Uliginosibacterium sp. H1]